MREPNTFRYLISHFNKSANDSQQLPAEFERATSTTGIAAAYKFPGDKTAKNYDHWARIFCGFRNGDGKSQTSFLQKEWAKLLALNPQLEILQPGDNPSFIRDAIFGTATLFNPDDIKFFIELQKRTECSYVALLCHMVPEYDDLVNNIECRTKTKLQWVASPPTLVAIYKQVKDRPASRQPERKGLHGYLPEGEEITPVQIEKAQSFMNFPSILTL